MWVEFAVGSLLCSERFFSGFSGTPLSSKTNISKFQFDQESGRWRTILWMCYLQIIIYLFILPHRLSQCQSLLTTVLFRLLLPGRSYSTYLCKLTTLGFKQFTAWPNLYDTCIIIVSFHTNLLIYNNIIIITCHLTSHKLKEVVHKYVKLHSHFFFQNYQIDNPIMGHQQPCQEKQPVKTTTKTTCKLRELLTTTPA